MNLSKNGVVEDEAEELTVMEKDDVDFGDQGNKIRGVGDTMSTISQARPSMLNSNMSNTNTIEPEIEQEAASLGG